MSVNVSKYVNLNENYAIYGINGYFLEPFLIKMMIIDEIKLGMSFVELERFIEECEISVTEDEIKKFLDKKRSENYIGLKVNSKNNGSSILIQEDTTSEELEKTVKDALNYQCCSFDPYTLEYFKKYVAILKVKCSNLLKILDYLDKRKSMEISKDEWKALVDLDIHVNEEGNVYCEDINRLCEAIIYNINDLYKKVQEGNNLNTYLDFKISKEQLGRDGIFGEDLYPSEEIQIKDVTRGNSPEFIALTEKQKVELKKENLRNFSKFLDIINKSKEVTSEQKTNLEFKYKRNYED